MPVTTAEADARYAADWSQWPVPQQADILVEPWAGVPGSFWTEDISGRMVDAVRTKALVDVDVPITSHAGAPPWQGSSYGMPYQIIDSTAATTPVWDMSQPIRWSWFTPTFPIVNVPLPDVVRREGDPVGSSDLHWIGFDPSKRVLWEAITVSKPPFARFQTWGRCDWIGGYAGGGPAFSRWDTSKAWNAAGQPTGVVAAGIPKLPLLVRFDQAARAIASGDPDATLGHAIFGVLPNYNPGRVAPARGSDGSMSAHPVRAGERLRLPWHRAREHKAGTLVRVIANTLARRGWVQADRTSTSTVPKFGVGGFPMSLDCRWHQGAGPIAPLGPFEFRLADFEIILSS